MKVSGQLYTLDGQVLVHGLGADVNVMVNKTRKTSNLVHIYWIDFEQNQSDGSVHSRQTRQT
jgi:hypothetical protein